MGLAQRFHAEGAKLLLADIDDASKTAAARFAGAVYGHCDVGTATMRCAGRSGDQVGQIDVLVDDAGIVSPFLISMRIWTRFFVNLKGAFLMAQLCAARGGASEKGRKPARSSDMSIPSTIAIATVPYSISKGGVSQLTKVAALGLTPSASPLNAIGPGWITTEMLAAVVSHSARSRVMSRLTAGAPSRWPPSRIFSMRSDHQATSPAGRYADGGRLPLNYTVPVAS